MTVQNFVNQMEPWAKWQHEHGGLLPEVALAQWGCETAWGTSEAWLHGWNPAGISPEGHIAKYATVLEGMEAYVATVNNGYYTAVKEAAARGPIAQAIALGESPWAGGHYNNGSGDGSTLVAILTEDRKVPPPSTPATHTPPPPASNPPAVTPPWYEEAASHWHYTESVGKVLTGFYAVMDRAPSGVLEWQNVATWGYEIFDGKATLGGVLTAISELPGAPVKLRLA